MFVTAVPVARWRCHLRDDTALVWCVCGQVIAIMSASYEAVKQKAELEVLKLKAGEGSLSTLSDRIDMTAHATRHAGMQAGRQAGRQAVSCIT